MSESRRHCLPFLFPNSPPRDFLLADLTNTTFPATAASVLTTQDQSLPKSDVKRFAGPVRSLWFKAAKGFIIMPTQIPLC